MQTAGMSAVVSNGLRGIEGMDADAEKHSARRLKGDGLNKMRTILDWLSGVFLALFRSFAVLFCDLVEENRRYEAAGAARSLLALMSVFSPTPIKSHSPPSVPYVLH